MINELNMPLTYKEGKCNYEIASNQYLSDIWFDGAYDLYNGYGQVCILGMGWNFIKPEHIDNRWTFRYVSDTWFDCCCDFCCGIAKVRKIKYGWNFINEEGKLISDIWFRNAYSFTENLGSVVIHNNECFYITKMGDLMYNRFSKILY